MEYVSMREEGACTKDSEEERKSAFYIRSFNSVLPPESCQEFRYSCISWRAMGTAMAKDGKDVSQRKSGAALSQVL